MNTKHLDLLAAARRANELWEPDRDPVEFARAMREMEAVLRGENCEELAALEEVAMCAREYVVAVGLNPDWMAQPQHRFFGALVDALARLDGGPEEEVPVVDLRWRGHPNRLISTDHLVPLGSDVSLCGWQVRGLYCADVTMTEEKRKRCGMCRERGNGKA